MFKKVISIFLITSLILFLSCTVYGADGYWQEQWEAWGDSNNLPREGADPSNGREPDILDRIQNQDVDQLSKMSEQERISYLKLLNKVMADYGSNSSAYDTTKEPSLNMYKEQADKVVKKLNKNATSKEKKAIKDISDTYDISLDSIKAQEKNKKDADAGNVVSDEDAIERADSISQGVDNAENSKNGTTIYTLPKNNNTKVASESLDEVIEDGQDFVNAGQENEIETGKLQNFSNIIYNILLSIGVVVAVTTGGIIGIKLMTAGVEEKAEVKQLLVPYLVGCVVVFGGFAIWKIAVTVLQGMS